MSYSDQYNVVQLCLKRIMCLVLCVSLFLVCVELFSYVLSICYPICLIFVKWKLKKKKTHNWTKEKQTNMYLTHQYNDTFQHVPPAVSYNVVESNYNCETKYPDTNVSF